MTTDLNGTLLNCSARLTGLDVSVASKHRPNRHCNWPFKQQFHSELLVAVLLVMNFLLPQLGSSQVVAWGSNSFAQTNVPMGLNNVVAIAAGSSHSLALRADGTVVAWGSYYDGTRYVSMTVPSGLNSIVAIAAGWNHSLALRANGTVVAWGNNKFGQTYEQLDGLTEAAIAGGGEHSMAVHSDGTASGWGKNWDGQAGVPAGLNNVVAIAAGGSHSLVLRADGTVVAWGKYRDGNVFATMPSPYWLNNIVAIAAGGAHCLALRADGTVDAWGGNSVGQASVPAGLNNVVAIAAGGAHSLAVRADGTIVAWGRNDSGQTDVPAGLTNVLAVAAGGSHNLALVRSNTPTPLLTSSLVSRTALAGGKVFFIPAVTGAWPLSFQWRFNGQNLNGATNVWLELTNTQFSQAGVYSIVVSNPWVATASSVAALSVVPLAIMPGSGLLDQKVVRWGKATFQVQVQSIEPVRYQWRHNGVDLAGQTNSTLLITAANWEHQGTYSVVASNQYGAVESGEARFDVNQVADWGDYISGETEMPLGLSNLIAIAAGEMHSLALRSDGTMVAWGAYYDGTRFIPTTAPFDLTNIVAIAGGVAHSLALRANGTAVAWGYGSSGQAVVPARLSNVVAIAAGSYHNVALLKDGTIAAWGNNGDGQTNVPTGLSNVVAIAAGGGHTLALRANGTVVAWGMNTHGQTNVPSGLSNVVAIAAGPYHCLALRADGTVVAWGSYYYANLTSSVQVPSGLSNVVAIAGGSARDLALRADGAVVIWGWNYYDSSRYVNISLTNVVAIAAAGNNSLMLVGAGPPSVIAPLVSQTVAVGGRAFVAAVASGEWPLAFQWRLNGQAIPNATNSWLVLTNTQPAQAGQYSIVVSNSFGTTTGFVATLSVVSSPVIASQPQDQLVLLAGQVMFQVVTEGAEPIAYQWRRNEVDLAGQTNRVLFFDSVDWEHQGFYSVVISNQYGMVESRGARLDISPAAAWGKTILDQASILPALGSVVAIAGGWGHSLALRPDGTVVAWGVNDTGQTKVPAGLTNVVAVSAGSYHNLALRADGTVVAWGYNWNAQTNVPSGLKDVVAIAAGASHSLALRADGRVVAWGDNWYGKSSVPGNLSNVAAIAAGGEHSLALRADGMVVAWGNNSYGQANVPVGLSNVVAIAGGMYHSLALRADGTVAAWGSYRSGNQYFPMTVPSGLTNAVAVAAGRYHSLALRADGTVVAWGGGEYNQTSIPPGLSNVVAIAAGDYHSLVLCGKISKPAMAMFSKNQPEDSFSFQIRGRPGWRYEIESADGLGAGPDWQQRSSGVLFNSVHVFRDLSATNQPARFYRLRVIQ